MKYQSMCLPEFEKLNVTPRGFLRGARCTNASAFVISPSPPLGVSGKKASELGFCWNKIFKYMTRRKVNAADQLTCKIGLRVSEDFYKKMEGWLSNSNCQTVSELARMILYKEEIIWYHKDTASGAIAVELTAIGKELRSIGVNINQVTRYFNGTSIPQQKIFEALKILEEYKKVNLVVGKLTDIISKLNSDGRQGD